MPSITIPEGATPADIIGESDLLPGQEWLEKETVLTYASMMQEGRFPWQAMQAEQPMAVAVGTNGKVLSQGHHRWAAARLAKVAIPVEIEYRTEYLDEGKAVPFARTWPEVAWRQARR